MGRTGLSRKELSRVEVMGRVKANSLRLREAAELLELSYRQANRSRAGRRTNTGRRTACRPAERCRVLRALPGRHRAVRPGRNGDAHLPGQPAQLGRPVGTSHGVVARPHLVPLPPYTPPGGGSPILWGAALLRAGNVVYVYGTQAPDVVVPDRRLYLARVPVSQLTSFEAWRFYAGAGRWAAGQAATPGRCSRRAGACPCRPASA